MSSETQVTQLSADVSEKLLIDLDNGDSNPWHDAVGHNRQEEKQVDTNKMQNSAAEDEELATKSSIAEIDDGSANIEIQSILDQSIESDEEPQGQQQSITEANDTLHRQDTESSSHSLLSRDKGNPPPPEPDRPFEFGRFLDQLRHKSADPVARYMKSFLFEFSKKSWSVSEQVKIIHDFLNFIAQKMLQCDVWCNVSSQEFDNAIEGMEKLIMNRLYSQTFAPAVLGSEASPISPSPVTQPSTIRRRASKAGSLGDDMERDNILMQRIKVFSWITESHLDIPKNTLNRSFVSLAKQEFVKINNYRAPRDKVICILNCCKVIFGLLRHAGDDQSADQFMPLLIYVLLQSNVRHLISNVNYIQRFRNPDKLGGEVGYYLSSLTGAIGFIESMEMSYLTIEEGEFNRQVERAVAKLAEEEREEQAQRNATTQHQASRDLLARGGATAINTIRKPLTSLGRIFTDQDQLALRKSPSEDLLSHTDDRAQTSTPTQDNPSRKREQSAQEQAERLASAEQTQAERIQGEEHDKTLEALRAMFPGLDAEVVEAVVVAKQGRIGVCIDVCLELSA